MAKAFRLKGPQDPRRSMTLEVVYEVIRAFEERYYQALRYRAAGSPWPPPRVVGSARETTGWVLNPDTGSTDP